MWLPDILQVARRGRQIKFPILQHGWWHWQAILRKSLDGTTDIIRVSSSQKKAIVHLLKVPHLWSSGRFGDGTGWRGSVGRGWSFFTGNWWRRPGLWMQIRGSVGWDWRWFYSGTDGRISGSGWTRRTCLRIDFLGDDKNIIVIDLLPQLLSSFYGWMRKT